MDLRSSRSRSKTPFTQVGSIDTEVIEGNHLEKSVTRTTRTTTFTKYEGVASSSDEVASFEVQPARRSTRSERNIRRLYNTSDYSSEDGENEVSSTKTITQNERNQFIEDARAAANGNKEVSALNLYKKSGRYWDVYPKTDWTYSYHSKDRVELAPGVVAMPNMSRKTIHSVHGSDSLSSYANKETNTESSAIKANSYITKTESYSDYKPRQLFNNNYSDAYKTYTKTDYRYSRLVRLRQSVVRIFTSIYTSILTVFYYMFEVQTSWFAKLHQFTSRVMLLDTWLLRKTGAGHKSTKLLLLCLVPLCLLGGWWILTNLGSIVYGAYFNSTLVKVPDIENSVNVDQISINFPKEENIENSFKPAVEEEIAKIAEKIIIEPPSAAEIAAGLSTEQLNVISNTLKNSININEHLNTENVVRKIVESPSFQAIVENYNEMHTNVDSNNNNLDLISNQQNIIDGLKEEINKLKKDMIDVEKTRQDEMGTVLAQFQAENAQNYARLSYQLNRCCRKPVINIEGYVNRILTNLLNDMDFLKNQNGLTNYLNTIFAAKQDLEIQLGKLSYNLSSKYESLFEENSNRIMDDIARKIKLEMTEKFGTDYSSENTRETVPMISDERIKKIVKNVLTIYDADKTGLVDYAMESMGGQILTTRCTENYHYGKAVVSVLGIPLWYPVNSPRTIITPTISPGECWAFQNFPGFVVIRLTHMVRIEAFSMEHISKLLVPNGKIDSAPKYFEVYGLLNENDKEPVKLGDYTYDYDGEPLQFFAVQNEGLVFDIVELRIMSNHGNLNYTCLYRFRVHGTLSQELA